MHILIVNQFHRQPGGGGRSRLNELARNWTERGHEVTVVSSIIDHASSLPNPAYKGRWVTEEASDGARVLRTWTMNGDKSVPAVRIARDLSFAATASLGGLRSRGNRPDVILATSPPLFVGLAGVFLSRLYNVPLVFEVTDLWPDFAVEMGALRGRPASIAYKMEASLYRAAAKVVTVTPGFRDRLEEKGVPAAKIGVIPNGVDLNLFHPDGDEGALRRELGWEGKFVVLYAGLHGPAQALHQVIEAATHLSNVPDILFAFVGDGEEKAKLQRLAIDLDLKNVRFYGQVPRQRVPEFLRASEVALAPLKKLESFRDVYPAKIFEIMGCGRPIVVAAEGLSAALVKDAKAGHVVPPESPRDLAQAIQDLHDSPKEAREMGARGHRYVSSEFDRKKLADNYLDLMATVAAQKTR